MKELLGEELYNQVKEKLGDKELIINDGNYIPKSKFDDINNDKKELKKQLDEMSSKVDELQKGDGDIEKIKKDLQDLQTKYDTDTKALNDKISNREREYVINDLTRNIKFSSESAKKTFMRDLNDKGLKIENGKMLGFDDYLSSYKESDASAFIEEKKDEGKDISLGDNHGAKLTDDLSHEKAILGIK